MNIAELRRLEAEATPGPWEANEEGFQPWDRAIEIHGNNTSIAFTTSGHAEKANAALIVALRNALPELLDRLDDLVVENEMLRKVNSSLGHMLKPHGGVDVG